MLRILHTLVHEYVHDSSSSDQHPHDLAFYEDYHDIVSSKPIGKLACMVMERYWKQLEKKGLPVRRPTIQDLSRASVINENEESKPIKIAAKQRKIKKKADNKHTQLNLF